MSTNHAGVARDEALALVKQYLKNDRLIAHCRASEVIMRKLAERLGENPDIWGLAGLLHDIDFEFVHEDPARHGEEAAKILTEKGVSDDIVQAIRKHNAEGLGLQRSTRFDHALTCAESITGMIVATALILPEKKISAVKVKSVTKRMRTAHFARAVSRERIQECEAIGLSLDDFVALSIEAMSEIADELGL